MIGERIDFFQNIPNGLWIWDCGFGIAESIDYQHNPQSAIPNPKSVVYIKDSLNPPIPSLKRRELND
jgi:hypothetical protein